MHKYKEEFVNTFKGTGVALVTPFNSDDTIDFAGLEKIIEHVIAGGVEFLVSMGTTGESATLTEEERFSIIDFTLKTTNRRVPVVGGFGGNNTADIIRSINKYTASSEAGIVLDAVLIASPYYNKPTQEGIYRHYTAIDEKCSIPIILYNVPGRTSSNMEAETTLRIVNHAKHIIAIKEASGNFMQCMKIIKGAPKNFLVLSGDDPITLPFIALGMQGVISVVANAFPKSFSEMVRLSLQQNFTEANPLHYNLLNFTELIFKEGSPAGIKSALKALGLCGEKVRLPLWKISDELNDEIEKEILRVGDGGRRT